MKDYLEIQFFKIAKYILRRGYGYCEEPRERGDGHLDSGCAACKASDVQDWIDHYIGLLHF